MFWIHAFPESTITQLLNSPNVTVKSLLEDRDFLAETRAKNSKLIDFMASENRLLEMIEVLQYIPENNAEIFRMCSVISDAFCFDVPEWNHCFETFPSLMDSLCRIFYLDEPHPMVFCYTLRILMSFSGSIQTALLNYFESHPTFLGHLLKNLHLPGTETFFSRLLINENGVMAMVYEIIVDSYQLIPLCFTLMMDANETRLDLRQKRSASASQILTNILCQLRQEFRTAETMEWELLLDLQDSFYLRELIIKMHESSKSINDWNHGTVYSEMSTKKCEVDANLSQLTSTLTYLNNVFDMERNSELEGHPFFQVKYTPLLPWHSAFLVYMSDLTGCMSLLTESYHFVCGSFQSKFPDEKLHPTLKAIGLRFIQLFVSLIYLEISLQYHDSAKPFYFLSDQLVCEIIKILLDAFEKYSQNNILHSMVSILVENLFFQTRWPIQSVQLEQSPREHAFNDEALEVLLIAIPNFHHDAPEEADLSIELTDHSKHNQFAEVITFIRSNFPVINRTDFIMAAVILQENIFARLISLFKNEEDPCNISRSSYVRLMIANFKLAIEKSELMSVSFVDRSTSISSASTGFFSELIKKMNDSKKFESVTKSFNEFKEMFPKINTDDRFSYLFTSNPYGYGVDDDCLDDSFTSTLCEIDSSGCMSKFNSIFTGINDVETVLSELENVHGNYGPPDLIEQILPLKPADNSNLMNNHEDDCTSPMKHINDSLSMSLDKLTMTQIDQNDVSNDDDPFSFGIQVTQPSSG